MNLARELYEESDDPEDAHVKTRRKEVRRVTPDEPIDLEIDGKVYRFTAEARDAGTQSIGIVSKMPIKDGSYIRVRRASTEGEWNEAQVIHCTDTVGGYKIGLQIREE